MPKKIDKDAIIKPVEIIDLDPSPLYYDLMRTEEYADAIAISNEDVMTFCDQQRIAMLKRREVNS